MKPRAWRKSWTLAGSRKSTVPGDRVRTTLVWVWWLSAVWLKSKITSSLLLSNNNARGTSVYVDDEGNVSGLRFWHVPVSKSRVIPNTLTLTMGTLKMVSLILGNPNP